LAHALHRIETARISGGLMMQRDPSLVLLVDDDPELRALLERWLTLANLRVKSYASAEEFLDALATTVPDAVCMDVNLPGLSGLDALAHVQRLHPNVPVLMLTADGSVNTVVQAMQRGAHDYLTKPFERVKLVSAVTNALSLAAARADVAHLTKELDGHGYSGVIGRSPAMREVFRQIERVAGRDISVLVHGESGTGKELVARAIHDNSRRASGPFVAVNCAAIPESLQDSELFGHERGAFTGASEKRQGRFERADGGTLFLDEIAELSLGTQAKLLRVLQERSFERVGGGRTIRSDFRLVAATHRDLRKMVTTGHFREDLMFRIAVFDLDLPALRERVGDLPVLVPKLLARVAVGAASEPLSVSDEALRCLEGYSWPGNVRELENVLSRAAVLAQGGCIEIEDLPKLVRNANQVSPQAAPVLAPEAHLAELAAPRRVSVPAPPTPPSEALPLNLEELEQWAIRLALSRTEGQLTEAARILGIGRTTLYRKLTKYGIRGA